MANENPPPAPKKPAPAAPPSVADVAELVAEASAKAKAKTSAALFVALGESLPAPYAGAANVIAWGLGSGIGSNVAIRELRFAPSERVAKLLDAAVKGEVSQETVGAFLHREFPEKRPAWLEPG